MREPMTLDAVTRKFRPRIDGDHPCHSMIAETLNVPFGYAQWYLNRDFPDYGAAMIGKTLGVSIDYFIGNADYLGRGLGTNMLVALVSRVAPGLQDADRIFHIGHDNTNKKAIRCTTRAGFSACESFIENAVPSRLYVREETNKH
jgi:hypothetical protein